MLDGPGHPELGRFNTHFVEIFEKTKIMKNCIFSCQNILVSTFFYCLPTNSGDFYTIVYKQILILKTEIFNIVEKLDAYLFTVRNRALTSSA